MAVQPSGTVTLVFTDIDGSTALLDEIGAEAFKEAMADHLGLCGRLSVLTRPTRSMTRATASASLADDLGGIDAVYRVNHRCELQIRVRHDRPPYADDEDVAFRTTEPAMIDAGTYAALAFFLWMVNGYVEAGKLIDVYRMAERIDPPLRAREPKAGPDGQARATLPAVFEMACEEPKQVALAAETSRCPLAGRARARVFDNPPRSRFALPEMPAAQPFRLNLLRTTIKGRHLPRFVACLKNTFSSRPRDGRKVKAAASTSNDLLNSPGDRRTIGCLGGCQPRRAARAAVSLDRSTTRR